MRGRRSALSIQMIDQSRTTLQGWVHRQKIPHGQAKWARALLLLEQGHTFVPTAQYSRFLRPESPGRPSRLVIRMARCQVHMPQV
jgi:hypothetical protein